MKREYLAEHFTGVGFKRLSATEVDPKTSHGHEFQGIGHFRELFGTAKQEISATFLHLSDFHEDGLIVQEGDLTWYDSRENQPHRSPEYRLYYRADVTLVQEYALPGDLIVIARRPDEKAAVMIAAAGSTWEQRLLWLFGIEEEDRDKPFQIKEVPKDEELTFASRAIVEAFGFEAGTEDSDLTGLVLERFGSGFPTTRIFSDFAREISGSVSARDAPDEAYLTWMEHEERLFRAMERHLVADRLKEGFGEDVDDFISFSLSVQNRRKSRVGYAMENHLEALFIANNIHYSRGQVTENNSKPDFVFPGIAEYHTGGFSSAQLSMLGVKSSCKDRWRQVLSEASRIPEKHLLTLEPGISENQTDEMQANSLQLVVPEGIHQTYRQAQKEWLMNVSEFVELVQERQPS